MVFSLLPAVWQPYSLHTVGSKPSVRDASTEAFFVLLMYCTSHGENVSVQIKFHLARNYIRLKFVLQAAQSPLTLYCLASCRVVLVTARHLFRKCARICCHLVR